MNREYDVALEEIQATCFDYFRGASAPSHQRLLAMKGFILNAIYELGEVSDAQTGTFSNLQKIKNIAEISKSSIYKNVDRVSEEIKSLYDKMAIYLGVINKMLSENE